MLAEQAVPAAWRSRLSDIAAARLRGETLAQIGQRYGVTREYIRQIETVIADDEFRDSVRLARATRISARPPKPKLSPSGAIRGFYTTFRRMLRNAGYEYCSDHPRTDGLKGSWICSVEFGNTRGRCTECARRNSHSQYQRNPEPQMNWNRENYERLRYRDKKPREREAV